MTFEMVSMKQRAKALMNTAKPSSKAIGVIFGILSVIYITLFFLLFSKEMYIALIIAELVYLNFRTCCNWYALKVTREEQTSFSDCIGIFKSKSAVKIILLGIIREVLWVIGACVFIVGIVFPIYWFRFAPYILKDENVSIFKALSESKKLVKGHYAELIKLDISNIIWYAIMLFTWNIAGFYVKPYTSIVYAEFYDYLKACKEFKE